MCECGSLVALEALGELILFQHKWFYNSQLLSSMESEAAHRTEIVPPAPDYAACPTKG